MTVCNGLITCSGIDLILIPMILLGLILLIVFRSGTFAKIVAGTTGLLIVVLVIVVLMAFLSAEQEFNNVTCEQVENSICVEGDCPSSLIKSNRKCPDNLRCCITFPQE